MDENIFIDADERLDTIPGTDFSLIQKRDGTAFTVDTLLLADFVKLTKNDVFIGDLGSGSGILAFFMKYRKRKASVTGFEVQKELYDLSLRNKAMNVKFSDVSFENMDIRNVPSRMLPESFDIIVSNPPYFQAGNGRLPPNKTRAAARHELNGTLENFAEAASYLLKQSGKFYVVIPYGRFYEICGYFTETGLGLKRVQFICPKEGEKPHLVLIESEKGYIGPHEAVPEIAVHKADGTFGQYLDTLLAQGLKII